MGEYVEVNGLRTWFDEAGQGEPLLLLHGGLSTNAAWVGQFGPLAQRFRVVAPERRGHGHTPDVDGPLHYADMAADTIAFIDQVVGGPVHIVGWSDGGIVGLLVAIQRPDLVRKLVAVGANADTDGLVGGVDDSFEQMDPNGEDMAMFRQAYQAVTPDGPDHWSVVFGKFATMAATEPHIPDADLAGIAAPTMILVGDDDLITLEHTVHLYRTIPGAELAVIPGTSHGVLIEKADVCNRLIVDFLANDPVPTLIPMRRARHDDPGALHT